MRIRAALFALLLAAPLVAQESVQSLAATARIDEMRWPDFSDYRAYIQEFYRARNDAPAWTKDGQPTPQALALVRIFSAADAKGVNAADYDGDRWQSRIASLGPASLARFDVAMTATLMRYISDLHIGRINPHRVDFFVDVTHKFDLPALVSHLEGASDIAAELEKVEPRHPGYLRTRDALARYRALAAEPFTPLPHVKRLLPGGTWEGVPQLAALLHRLGDFDGTHEGEVFDAPLVEGVKRFQTRHGLEPDGTIGAATLKALNTTPAERVRQIQLVLERWRWLPEESDPPPIVINIPEFKLRALDADEHAALTMNVIVGSAFKQTGTPVFTGMMNTVVFQPYWNVPPSIQRNEIEPKAKEDPDYLRRNNYERFNGSIRQKPGPTNALGSVKFLFPNSMNIYLHDTPAKGLFDRTRRDFSHGCIRVENPAALAEWVLRNDPKWTRAAIQRAMTSGPIDAHVPVRPNIAVWILYGTAVAPEDGKIYFFDDIYGLDAKLEDALAGGYPYPW